MSGWIRLQSTTEKVNWTNCRLKSVSDIFRHLGAHCISEGVRPFDISFVQVPFVPSISMWDFGACQKPFPINTHRRWQHTCSCTWYALNIPVSDARQLTHINFLRHTVHGTRYLNLYWFILHPVLLCDPRSALPAGGESERLRHNCHPPAHYLIRAHQEHQYLIWHLGSILRCGDANSRAEPSERPRNTAIFQIIVKNFNPI